MVHWLRLSLDECEGEGFFAVLLCSSQGSLNCSNGISVIPGTSGVNRRCSLMTWE